MRIGLILWKCVTPKNGMNYQQYNNNVYNNDRSTYGQRVIETTNYQANNYNFQQTVPNQFNN